MKHPGDQLVTGIAHHQYDFSPGCNQMLPQFFSIEMVSVDYIARLDGGVAVEVTSEMPGRAIPWHGGEHSQHPGGASLWASVDKYGWLTRQPTDIDIMTSRQESIPRFISQGS